MPNFPIGIKNIYYQSSKNMNLKSEDDRFIGNKGDSIYNRYEIIDKKTKGTFSNVYKVIYHKYNKYRVIKIIRNNEYFNKQAKTEFNILSLINIV